MLVDSENNFLTRVVGNLNAPGAVEKIEALAHMDPLSLGLLTGKLVTQEQIIETPHFTVKVKGFARRP